ncbi:MAG: phosphotransferase [Chloroflexota bacterium]
MATNPTAELNAVLAHYDLGHLVHWQLDQRGTVNVSYVVETDRAGHRSKYFLRRYKRGISGDEIRFEHALIRHLAAQGTCPVARVHPTRTGPTFLHRTSPDGEDEFYAVFDYLTGEDRYTWVGPRCTGGELQHAGALLAEFHRGASTLVPEGRRLEPKILDLLEIIERAWSEAPSRSKGTIFDRELTANFAPVQRSIAETRQVLHEAAPHLPECVIHCDYHPGNLKFEGEAITGLVDFDWSKRDLRGFDVGLALWYFCVSWEGRADGRLRLGEASAFISAYQSHLRSHAGLPPLSAEEIRALPHLINAGNIYVLYWTLRDYFGKEVDPEEYRLYLRHGIAFARWFASGANRQRLQAMLERIPLSP